MTVFTGIVLQLIPISANLAIAMYQAYRFDVLQKRINHTAWMIYYALFCLLLLFFIPVTGWRIAWIILAAGAMHFPVFSVALNLFRHKEWDYRNVADPEGSAWDKRIGKWWVEVFFGSIGLWIGLQFLIF